jgi:hypothetical protein
MAQGLKAGSASEPPSAEPGSQESPSESLGKGTHGVSTHIHASTNVRKMPGSLGEYLGARCDRMDIVETPLDRIRWVMKVKGWSESQWAKEAELKERSNVNKLIKRMVENPGEIVGDMKTIAKLADAAKVSLDWLVLGRGAPSIATFRVADDAKYPTRPSVLVAGHILGFPEAALAAVEAFDAGPVDPGADYWLQLLLGKRAEFSVPQPHQLGGKS